MTEYAPEHDTLPTVDEVLESLTGFDEIAIEKHLGIDPYMDGEAKPILLMRGLVFVLERRAGHADADAKQLVMNAPLSAINGRFDDAPEDLDPDEPDTAQGKGDTAPASAPGA